MSGETLPIHSLAGELRATAGPGARLIVRAPTGSGKSTQIPQLLLDAGALGAAGQVVILQPRRLAARLLAARVARERGARLGAEVGYRIRFDHCASAATRIAFVTEGILLRQLLAQPRLDGVTAVILDEFHERHLYGDLTLAQLLRLQETDRPDLRLLVMSATLDTAALEPYLAPCRVLTAEGRQFPVTVDYLSRPPDPQRLPIWEAAADAFAEAARAGDANDTLIFMPGAYEIQRTLDALRDRPESAGWELLPLHGELPPAAQDKAVAPCATPKVIVATNVAETSLTIEGIRLVIDGGLARRPRYDPHRGINTLLIERISRAAAEQRAGRAGRTGPGRCVRLWTEHDHAARPLHETPEIRRLDLAEAALLLKGVGTARLTDVRWLDPPDEKSAARAETLLADLGAADPATGEITPLGRRMLAFPVHPRYARMLLAAADYGCVRQAALMAALTQGRGVLQRAIPRDAAARRDELLGETAPSDFFRLARAWQFAANSNYDPRRCAALGIHAAAARAVTPLFDHLLRIARAEGLPVADRPADDEAVQKCILAGFADQVARRLDGGTFRCDIVHGRRGTLDPDTAVRDEPLLVAAEVTEIEGRDVQVRLSLLTATRLEWLRELFPSAVRAQVAVRFDADQRRVVGDREVRYHDLPLVTRAGAAVPPADEAARLLAARAARGDFTPPHWDERAEQWIARINFLAQHRPDLGLPAFTPEDRELVLQQLCLGCFSEKEVKARAVRPVLESWLDASLRPLPDRYAPEALPLPNGRRGRLTYPADGRPPALAARIQDLYGWTEAPRVAGGRIPVTLSILAPNQRPVQTTGDLAAFWREVYPKIKPALQRRYPRHEWR